MATKNLYGKANGVFFHHYVQSFSPEENVTAQEAHQIGLELAQRFFTGCEVVVATHLDADHLHSHFVINSVMPDTGKKVHFDAVGRDDIFRSVITSNCRIRWNVS